MTLLIALLWRELAASAYLNVGSAALARLAVLAEAEGDQALAAFERATALSNSLSRQYASRQEGLLLARMGRYDLAVERLEEVTRQSSDVDWRVYKALGDSYEALGQMDVALRAWTIAGAARYFELHQDWARAAAVYDLATRVTPNSVDSRVALGHARLQEDRPDLAIGALEPAVKLDPGRLAARFWLAKAYLALEQWEKASAEFAEVLRLYETRHSDDDDADTKFLDDAYQDSVVSLAYTYKVLGKLDLAERYFAQAQTLWPNDLRSYGHLSDIYVEWGQPRKALAQLQAFVDVGKELQVAERLHRVYLSLGDEH